MGFRSAPASLSLGIACCLMLAACSAARTVPSAAINSSQQSVRAPEVEDAGHLKVTTLFTFSNGAMGITPNAPLARDAQGNYYGTTLYGGTADAGVLFELSPQNGTYVETILFNFQTQFIGKYPGPVSRDSNGNFWGITVTNFNPSSGGFFELTPSNGQLNPHVLDDKCTLPYSIGSVALYGGKVFAACGGRVDEVPSPGQPVISYRLRYGPDYYFNGGITVSRDGRIWGSTFFAPDCCAYAGPTYQGTPQAGRYAFNKVFTLPTFAAPGLGPDGSLYETGFPRDQFVKYGKIFKMTPKGKGFNKPVIIYKFVQSGARTPPAIDRSGAVYFADGGEVKKLTPSGNTYTASVLYTLPYSGDIDGVWLDNEGNVFGAGDTQNHTCPSNICGTIFEISKN